MISIARTHEPIHNALMRSVRKSLSYVGSLQEKGDADVADYLQKGGALGERRNEGERGEGRRRRSSKCCAR